MTKSATPSVPAAARPAWLALGAASARLAHGGHRPPCARDPRMWDTDADAASRAEAAEACNWCPLIHPCRVYADHAGEVWHVWGGRDRTVHRTYAWRTTG